MRNSLFQSILFESQQQFEQLLEDNKVGNTLKKAGSNVKKTIKKSGSTVKETASHVASTVASKTKSKATESLKSTGKSVKEKAKSGLDSLKTVSKNTSSKVSEKIKSVGNKVKETAKNPIKAGTIAGTVAGGVTGGMVGFGVGNMVKDVSDGVKEVKSKLLESYEFENPLELKLQTILADLHIIYQKTRNFHWNVKTILFYELHNLFNKQYDILSETIDDFAEYLRQQDMTPNGTFTDYYKLSNLKDDINSEKFSSNEMINTLIEDYNISINYMKSSIVQNEEIRDNVLIDTITTIIHVCEKNNWMLKSMQT